MSQKTKILDFERFKLKKFLEDAGFQWHEDKKGQVKLWIRKAAVNHSTQSDSFFPEKQ